MFLKSSLSYINEFFFIFKNQIRKIYLNSSIYNRKISQVDENVLVYQPGLNILSLLIKYEKQKKKIEDFNVQSIWENKDLKYNDFFAYCFDFSINIKQLLDNVKINDDDEKIKKNRYRLLNFSKNVLESLQTKNYLCSASKTKSSSEIFKYKGCISI